MLHHEAAETESMKVVSEVKTNIALTVSGTRKKHLDGGFRNTARLCRQVETATYVVRCACVQRSVYVRTSFGVCAYSVRRTSSSG